MVTGAFLRIQQTKTLIYVSKKCCYNMDSSISYSKIGYSLPISKQKSLFVNLGFPKSSRRLHFKSEVLDQEI